MLLKIIQLKTGYRIIIFLAYWGMITVACGLVPTEGSQILIQDPGHSKIMEWLTGFRVMNLRNRPFVKAVQAHFILVEIMVLTYFIPAGYLSPHSILL